MNNGTGFVLGLTLGAAAGAVVTWLWLREKYEQITREEIDSVKEMYANKYQNDEQESEPTEDVEDSEETEYEELVENYTSNNEEKGGSESMEELIKVISPDEVGDIPDYDIVTLYYYADGVLADENEEEIEDPYEILGKNALNSFGVYEDDSVFVQNDDRKCYYEILQDVRPFSAGVSADLLNQAHWYDEE